MPEFHDQFPLWNADLPPLDRFDDAVIELPKDRLRFSEESASLIKRAAPLCNGLLSVFEIATELGVNPTSLVEHLEILKEADIVLDIGDYKHDLDAQEAIFVLRKAAKFYNMRVMANKTVRDLFSGKASNAVAMGYAVEFYFYVSAASSYMALGPSRFDTDLALLEPFLRHFAEEAKHSELFRDGLTATGVPASRLKPSKALATTSALTNFLFEKSSRSLVEYGSLFAIMQPNEMSLTRSEVIERYNGLRAMYPNMAPVWNAFQKHDLIDVDSAHNSWALESFIRSSGGLSRENMSIAFRTIRDSSCFFLVFFDGIREYYDSNIKWLWRYEADCRVE